MNVREKAKLLRLSKKLFALQEGKNDGRGVSCVRGVCTYLEMGDAKSARLVAELERDKLDNYPDIVIFIHENDIGDMGFYYDCAKRRLS